MRSSAALAGTTILCHALSSGTGTGLLPSFLAPYLRRSVVELTTPCSYVLAELWHLVRSSVSLCRIVLLSHSCVTRLCVCVSAPSLCLWQFPLQSMCHSTLVVRWALTSECWLQRRNCLIAHAHACSTGGVKVLAELWLVAQQTWEALCMCLTAMHAFRGKYHDGLVWLHQKNQFNGCNVAVWTAEELLRAVYHSLPSKRSSRIWRATTGDDESPFIHDSIKKLFTPWCMYAYSQPPWGCNHWSNGCNATKRVESRSLWVTTNLCKSVWRMFFERLEY